MNLLLTMGMFLWGIGKVDKKLLGSLATVFLIGYGVEVAGVNTGVLFGDYHYGSPLGWQIFNVPLMIGVNWVLLSLAAFGIANKLMDSAIAKVVLASILMVLLDFVIEPVAVTLDFWNWVALPENLEAALPRNYDIPLQNYIMWFVTALGVNSIWYLGVKHIDFKLSCFILGLQLIFFAILNMIL